MEIEEESDIPAFTMWQLLVDTMPGLLRIEGEQNGIKQLANIIISKEHTNIFVYTKDPKLSWVKYNEITDKYKSFTTWLLGRLFYMSSLEKLSRIHNVIIEAQLSILEQISSALLHVYREFTDEYSNILRRLTSFLQNDEQKCALKVFVPQIYEEMRQEIDLSPIEVEIHNKQHCESMVLKVLKFFKYILEGDFVSHRFTPGTFQNLTDVLYLLSTSNLDVKFEIMNVYVAITDKYYFLQDSYPEIEIKLLEIASVFEQLVYEVYNDKINLNAIQTKVFENIVTQFLNLHIKLTSRYEVLKIATFLMHKNCQKGVADKVQESCAKILEKYSTFTTPNNLNFRDVFNINNNYNYLYVASLKKRLISEITDYKKINSTIKKIKLSKASEKWASLHESFVESRNFTCSKSNCIVFKFLKLINYVCAFARKVLLEIKASLGNEIVLEFVNEPDLFYEMIIKILKHDSVCEGTKIPQEIYMNIFKNYPLLTGSTCNLDIIFNIVCCPLLGGDVQEKNFIEVGDVYSYKKMTANFYDFLKKQSISKAEALTNVGDFFEILSRGIVVDLNFNHLETVERFFGVVYQPLIRNYEESLSPLVIKTIPSILTLFPSTEKIFTGLIVPALSKRQLSKEIITLLPTIICMSSSNFLKVIQWSESSNNLETTTYCVNCFSKLHDFNNDDSRSLIEVKLQENFEKNLIVTVQFGQLQIDLQSYTNLLLKNVLKFVTAGEEFEKIAALKVLPTLSSHVQNFHFTNVTKIWMEAACDQSKAVRAEFNKIIYSTVKHAQENVKTPQKTKEEILEVILGELLRVTKKSLIFSEYDLQETVLSLIEELSGLIKVKLLIFPLINLLLYFIIFVTSKHSLVAVSKFFGMAAKLNTNATKLYTRYKRELSETLVHVCAANQAALNYNLGQSLEKVSLMLGFEKLKDFVGQACSYLLPHFVSKSIKLPAVKSLIKEMAYVMDVELSELLSSNYGTIFVHVFLNEAPVDSKACLRYVEENCEQIGGSTLRKQNFRVISNELLINFHDKKDQVILALQLLAKEDALNKTTNIPDYLQSQFLGVLQYFDAKLIDVDSKKDKVLQSLADLLRFMSSKHLVPLRYKIIAMLQTTDYGDYPELICDVWDSFVRTCPVEVLGPQLATIFISVLPLIQYCPLKVNNIFKFLIVQNEACLKDYITDLFFITNGTEHVDQSVHSLIENYLKKYEHCDLREKIRLFLRYATHETLDVKIQGLKYLKILLEENREDLDQMVLGYNGIDPLIVELIDVATLGCREKSCNLKLICGELIGELGAVEPSHLPRRYSQEKGSFAFFINDDPFIVASLNELTKALQAVKNTQKMDRYSLAIQEILKFYEISPEESNARNKLWKQLSECQQELMKPLLSSRYTIIQPSSTSIPCPVFGSHNVTSFHGWLSMWTSSLIGDLPQERGELLQQCFPSMQHDHRILMHFLPLILLHSLIEGRDDPGGKAYFEMSTVISSVLNPKKVATAVLRTKPISIPGITASLSTTTAEEVQQIQCNKVVFLLLDFLDRWVREWQWGKGPSERTNYNYKTISAFLERFCKLELAKCNYRCGEYPRALMYLEDYITQNCDDISSHLLCLAEIYAQLDEPDGVAGVTALRQVEPSIEERILGLEVSGKLSDAAACYERIPLPLKLHHIQGLVHCYLDLDNVNTALNFAQGVIDLQPEFGNMLLEMQAEPLWRLGRYKELEDLLKKPELEDNKSWGVQVGKALINLKQGNQKDFSSILKTLKMQQVESLGSASLEVGAYQHGYSYISRLHALNELEQTEKCVREILLKPNDSNSIEQIINKLSKEWDLRIKVVHESVRIIQPLLCLRRIAIERAKGIVKERAPRAVQFFNSLLGELWLLSAKTARAAGIHQQAYTYTLKAEEYAPPKLFVEKAKLHWLREEQEQALTTLRRGVALIIPPGGNPSQAIAALSLEQRKLCAEAKLLIASYNDSTSNVDTETNVMHYKEAVDVYKEWEKSLVCLGQYYDRIYQQYSGEDRDSKGSDIQIHMINFFGKSLLYGTNYVYQSMPRILSIWFDYGTRVLEVQSSTVKEERKTNLCKMSKLIDSFLERLPSFIFLTAFSQLVSRICHPQREVYIELKSIIIKLLIQYPQQTLWMIISVIKSGYAVRAKRCAEILGDSRLKTTTMVKLVKDFTNLAEKLIELCNKEIPQDATTITVSSLLRQLPRMLNKSDFSEIMVPTHKFRKLILPNPDFKNSQHNPFPNHYVHIAGIEEEVVILQSLQRPRKVTFKGSDGKSYIQMLKPKDDLRKDFRLMEFNDIVNQLLSREPEARQRRLNIRLYSVSPLNEECGLIEWVPNLVGLRPIVMNIYKQKGLGMGGKELKESCCSIRDSLQKKRDVFTKKLLPRFPPVLNEWFRKNFPDAQNWLTARTAYIRTTAVISMVGFILGLGDRHGENILLDSMCGDTVHVDFNCLFNKGESFEWPERVPFRLTQNMVSAMGPLGVEGVFRKSCACTLRVLRTNATTLMSIVTPFVYDPLVSWPRNVPSLHVQNAERTNDQALEYVKNIELRLQGIIKVKSRAHSIPLSVEGQTNNLIKEAMNIDNLCQMYMGWGPHL